MAAPFRFALQAVLDARRHAEDEMMQDLTARCRALDASAGELERISGARDRSLAELVTCAHVGAAVELRVRDAYVRRLDAAFADESVRRGKLFAAWESARDAFISARRARRTLERLKERRRLAYQAEEARREELELDESNARAYDRARRERPAHPRTGSATP